MNYKVKDGTVYYIDEYGGYWDLNAEGDPINSSLELENFIDNLWMEDIIDEKTAYELLDQIEW